MRTAHAAVIVAGDVAVIIIVIPAKAAIQLFVFERGTPQGAHESE